MPFFISLIACALCAIIIIGTVWYCAYRGKQLKQVQQELAQLEPKVQQLKKTEVQVQKHLDKLKVETRATRESFAGLESALEQTRTSAQSTIDSHLEQWYQMRHDQYQTALRAQQQILQNTAQNEIAQQQQDLNNQIATTQETLAQIKSEIADWEARRAAINQEIRREEELELQQNAHRIILSETAKQDIHYLVSIMENIHNKDILYKLIWSEYLMKPFQNMIKVLFGNNIPSGVIYCIETLDGKKKYIGKTQAEVAKRWTEHIKTSLNIGSVSRSKLHDALFLHWDEYLFSVLEVVPKEQLSAREKYYISFFQSDIYGLNMKSGG